jgi:hypothetical protein
MWKSLCSDGAEMFESGFGRNSQRSCRFGGILGGDWGSLRLTAAPRSVPIPGILRLDIPAAGTFAFVTG